MEDIALDIHVREHTKAAVEAVRDLLPADIKVVHEYGCTNGQGTAWLAKEFDTVVGFDINNKHIDKGNAAHPELDLRVCDVHHPEGNADLIMVAHVMEAYKINPPEVIDNLRRFCRFLLLAVHTAESNKYGPLAQWGAYLEPFTISRVELDPPVTPDCTKADTILLLRGHLA